MQKIIFQKSSDRITIPSRLVFQNLDRAPKSQDTFKSPEQQTEAQAISEVASQSPGDIFNDTMGAGTGIKNQYAGGTIVLAGLINTDPIFTGNWGGTVGTGGGTTGTGAGAGTTTATTDATVNNTSNTTTTKQNV